MNAPTERLPVDDRQDNVNVVGHDDPFIQPDIGEMGGDIQQTLFRDIENTLIPEKGKRETL